jgi:hypothetical protein
MSSRSFRRRNSRRRRQGTAHGSSPAGGPGPSGPRAGEGAAGPGGFQVERPPRPSGGNGSRGGSRGRPSANRGAGTAPEPLSRSVPFEAPDCPLCGKPVRELSSALTHKPTRKPAHFDCVVRELRESNDVAPQERICYLGGGSFGILEFRPPGSASRFVIRKRIQYEEKELPQDWKKTLVVPC